MNNDNKYDVGIVGYWWSTNYGSVATYYALYKIINNMGLKPVLIDRPESASSGEGLNVFSRGFMNTYAEVSKSCRWDEYDKINDMCNTFVVGSDQVWTTTSIKAYNYFFFLDFAGDEKKKLAYAASFGEYFNADDEEKQKAGEYLKRFSYVSVREFQAVDICKNDLGVSAEWVMDPIFLLDKDEWLKIAENAERKTADILGSNCKYLFAYILNPSEEKSEIINKAAKYFNLPVICILDGRKGTFDENNKILDIPNTIVNPSEEEWLYFLSNAEYIVTDSQHGSAFSIVFNKQFICCSSKKWGQARFESLFGLLNLKNRQAKSMKEITSYNLFERKIDYDYVNNILRDKIKVSENGLLSALEFDTSKIMSDTVMKTAAAGRCSSCGACVQLCPEKAIKLRENSGGFLYPDVNAAKCASCGLCLKSCPQENPQYKNSKDPKCYAVMASDEIRRVSSSGGMFTVAAEYIIENGGYVCGAAYTENFTVEHIIVNDKKDLDKLRGSKYIQSNTNTVFTEIKKLLNNGKTVLFTGMPCQTAGLYAYLGKDYENLYSIDLFCHGITSFKVFEKYRQDVLKGKKLTDLQFRAKKPWGWRGSVNAYFEDGTKYSVLGGKDPYISIYLKYISRNTACGHCRSSMLPRQGDISIGDFWEINKADPEMHDKRGTSAVLINNKHGETFFDILKDRMKKYKEEPLSYAVAHNKPIIAPLSENKNHNEFFKNLNTVDFTLLTYGCINNRIYDAQKEALLMDIPENELELYYLARSAAELSCGRKVVTWPKSPEFERIIKKYFGINVEFSITDSYNEADNKSLYPLRSFKGKSRNCYIVATKKNYSPEIYKTLEEYGYKEKNDFIFRIHKSIVLKEYNCKNGFYSDIYGNTIDGYPGTVIKEVVFHGCNNHIVIGNNVKNMNNVTFDLSTNSYIRIGDECTFVKSGKINITGLSGSSVIKIGHNCYFHTPSVRCINSPYVSSIFIGDYCHFADNFEFHANSGKKIIISDYGMFSRNIELWAGDGHSIFDVNTGKNTNSIYPKLPPHRNKIFFDEHVWVAKNAFIMHGTSIGSGSIVGAGSVVKGKYPNNCTICGNPSTLARENIAWSRDITSEDPESCNGYYAKTTKAAPPVNGVKVLVIGGTEISGKETVKRLVRLGNSVTVLSKKDRRDGFGIDVNRIYTDISDPNNLENALKNNEYDAVFDCTYGDPAILSNILGCVRCKRYIRLSSAAVYSGRQKELKENWFVPEAAAFNINTVNDGGNAERQRCAEALMFQKYGSIPSAAVRIPYIITERELKYYCDNIINETPMYINDPDRYFTLIRDTDVGRFLPWIAAQEYCGTINFASVGQVSVKQIIEYIERCTGKKAIISDDDSLPKEPFTALNKKSFSMNTDKAASLGYKLPVLDDWIYKYIEKCIK